MELQRGTIGRSWITPDIQLEQQPTSSDKTFVIIFHITNISISNLVKASTPIGTDITPDVQLEQRSTTEAAGPIETQAPSDTQEIVPAAEANKPASNEFFNTGVPTCANRRYPPRNRKSL